MLSAALGLGLVGSLLGQEPARLGVAQGEAVKPRAEASANQKIAETIADHLRQSAYLQGLKIDIAFQQGVAELTGAVATPQQREEAVRIAQGIPGVECVRDRMVMGGLPLMQVQAAMPQVGDVPALPRMAPPPVPMVATPFSMPSEPMAISQVGYGSPYALNTPMMPPYAWPTYAPYNNYSRVAYPTAYPYNAFPFIGPQYPFPKVPLGWRKVQLEWQDGHWWFGKVATCYDWWRLRYW
ncbi:hypothetical protein AYO44_00855 [Planctomycetaceae bacterium SCGC AG-212-F19]|nr:hypothetical protein AYO44_00855 [Planctomycetaceae bacterium SCGC AG-212-F19]